MGRGELKIGLTSEESFDSGDYFTRTSRGGGDFLHESILQMSANFKESMHETRLTNKTHHSVRT